MGADGGTKAKRSDLVQYEEGPQGPRRTDSGVDGWTICRLSGKPLSDPVVSDWQGRLFNRQATLEYLLGYRGQIQPRTVEANDMRSIKDVVTLHRKIVDGYWQCELTGQRLAESGASTRFAYIAECGHVADRSLLEQQSACPLCGTAYTRVVTLNATGKDLDDAKERLRKLRARGLRHSLSPLKKKTVKHGHAHQSAQTGQSTRIPRNYGAPRPSEI